MALANSASVSPALGLDAWARYWADATWRSVEMMDTLRERAANMRQHTAAGMPPLLHFDSETVAEGREFTPPSNYRLLRITRCGTDALEKHVRRSAAPVIRTPLVIFSSYGDNITPPHQALGWLRPVYPSTEALVAAGQRIVYLLNPTVGHMGIFGAHLRRFGSAGCRIVALDERPLGRDGVREDVSRMTRFL